MITKASLRQLAGNCIRSTQRTIEQAPVPAFFAGVFIGMLLIVLRALIYPLLVICAICLLGIWLFASDGPGIQSGASDKSEPGRTPDIDAQS